MNTSINTSIVEIDDAEIIRQVLAGDKEKYALLMRKYNQRVYRICKGYLRDEAEVEDVMQDAYVKAFQSLGKFEQKAQFSTWVIRIAINECLQRLKKAKRVYAMDITEETKEIMHISDKDNPEKQSLTRELKILIEAAVSQLPEKYRAIFLMREVERMSVGETSEVLDISETNVKVRLNRAKEMLRQALLDTYPMGQLYEFHLSRCERLAARVLSKI